MTAMRVLRTRAAVADVWLLLLLVASPRRRRYAWAEQLCVLTPQWVPVLAAPAFIFLATRCAWRLNTPLRHALLLPAASFVIVVTSRVCQVVAQLDIGFPLQLTVLLLDARVIRQSGPVRK